MSNNLTDRTRDSQLEFLRLLAGMPASDQFFDVRWRRHGGVMRRRFLPARGLKDASRKLTSLAPQNDVYVGVALRDGDAHGGRGAISGSHLVWVESDDPQTADRLAKFAHRPAMVIASGSPGHLQIYWLLDRRRPVDEVERINRRLALALGGDPACADGARILRPPDTLNHKHAPPRSVRLLHLDPAEGLTPARLTMHLPADPEWHEPRQYGQRRRADRPRLERDLLAIEAAEYVHVLTGLSPNREGKIRCPFHDDSNPSLQLYADGGFYCFGSGCRRGGTIFDFAGHLWGIPTKGVGFLELRCLLVERFSRSAHGGYSQSPVELRPENHALIRREAQPHTRGTL